MSKIITPKLKVSDEHAKDVQMEYEMLKIYPDIIGGKIQLTDEIPIEIYPARMGERFPSVILYDEKARPFLHMFNAELIVSDEEITFTTFRGGWAVTYGVGDEDENKTPPRGGEDAPETQSMIEVGKDNPTPDTSGGASSWSWELVNGIYKKVRRNEE